MTRTNQKGQTVLEALVVSSAFLSLVCLLASCIYMAWFYTCLNFISHEYLICRSISSPLSCDLTFQKQLRKISVFGKTQGPQVHQTPQLISLSILIQWRILHLKLIDIQFKDQIHLPLQTSDQKKVLSP